jgi:hypothetical protein
MEGFEYMGNYVKSIFSSSDYCGKYNNVAAIGILKKNYDLVTKSIPSNTNYPKDKLWFNNDTLDEHIGGNYFILYC